MGRRVFGKGSDGSAAATPGAVEPETVHVQAKHGAIIKAELPNGPNDKQPGSPREFDVEAQTPRADLRAQQAAGNMPLSSATATMNKSDRSSKSPRSSRGSSF